MRLKVRMHLFAIIIFVSSIDHVKSSININLQARIDATINTIGFCFSNEAKHGTVFVGNPEGFNIDLLMNYGPVIFFNKLITADELNANYKLNIFIVTIEPDFEVDIQQLKKSPWWNHEGFFIILDNGLSTNCKNARNILRKIWKMDILRAIFICTGGEKDRVNFYTFNPFTNRAPSFWEESRYIKKKSEDQLTLYRRQYNPKILNCKSLDYDKARHLDGYRGIRAAFRGKHSNEKQKAITEFLYEQLNVTISYSKMDDISNTNSQGVAISHIGNLLANGSIDIRIRLAPRIYMRDIASSNMVYLTGFTFISQNRGKKTMLHQIYELFGWQLILLMLFFSATTVLMFKICMKMDIDLAILEIIRMWGNASFLKQPTDLPSRIYLFGILLLALILCSVFQGKILGFQMNPNSEKNIDTMEDLIETFKDYKIYGNNMTIDYLDEKLINRYVRVKDIDSCVEHVLNNSKNVCAYGIISLTEKALQYPQLYLAKKPFIMTYTAFVVRKNWPLKKRVNKIIEKYFEHELIEYKLLRYNRIQNVTSDEPRPLKREHINFALKFLATGLSIGFCVFIVELFSHNRTRSIILQLSFSHFIRNMKRKLRA